MDNERLDMIANPKPEATPWPQQSIPIDSIYVGQRLRQLNEEEVIAKMDSIRELGLLNAITVTENPGDLPYRLRAGSYRLEACKRLGWKEIPATVTTLTGPLAELIEVDENLMQTTLTPSERATFTARRKELYLKLHPETDKGVSQGEGKKRAEAERRSLELNDNIGDEISDKPPTFSEDTADKTGKSKRSIERDAERGEKVSPDAMAAIKGTSLDTGKYLDQLKGLSPREQMVKVKQWLADEEKPKSSRRKSSGKGGGKGGGSKTKTPQTAKGSSPEEKHASDLLRLSKAWNPVLDIFGNTSSLSTKKEFVQRVSDDLDAEIRFAGETFAPSRPQLNGGDADERETVH